MAFMSRGQKLSSNLLANELVAEFNMEWCFWKERDKFFQRKLN